MSRVLSAPAEGTFQVKNTVRRPKITVSADGKGLVSQAGALLLAEAARVTGLGQGLSDGLARWRAPRAVHDPGKILTDLVMTLALGGDCLADVAVLRAQPELAGPVASDPVISRLVTALAADAPRALRAIRKARAAARERAWALAGDARARRGRVADPGGHRCHDRARALREGESRSHLEEDVRVPSRWPRSPTTAPGRAGSRWPSCCAPATPGRTPRASTSR